jgi:hypothetical protein
LTQEKWEFVLPFAEKRWPLITYFQREWSKAMPLKRTEAKIKLIENITKAIKEARDAGVSNPLELLKKALDSRIQYRTQKTPKTK